MELEIDEKAYLCFGFIILVLPVGIFILLCEWRRHRLIVGHYMQWRPSIQGKFDSGSRDSLNEDCRGFMLSLRQNRRPRLATLNSS